MPSAAQKQRRRKLKQKKETKKGRIRLWQDHQERCRVAVVRAGMLVLNRHARHLSRTTSSHTTLFRFYVRRSRKSRGTCQLMRLWTKKP